MRSGGSLTFNFIVLIIIRHCFHIKSIWCAFLQNPFSPQNAAHHKKWSLVAVKGISGGHLWLVSLMFVCLFVSWMLALTFQVLQTVCRPFHVHGGFTFQEDGASCRAMPTCSLHRAPASGACGTSATCWVMSTFYVICRLLNMHIVCVSIYYACIYVHVYINIYVCTYGCMAFE